MKQIWKALTALLLGLALLLGGCASPAPKPGTQPGAGEAPRAVPTPSPLPPPTERPLSAPEPQSPELVIWLSEDQPLSDSVAALAKDFAAEHPELSLSLRRFPSARMLDAALAEESPNLLLCDAREAARLLEAGALGALPLSVELAPLFRDAPGLASYGYFPLGAELPVLVTREENRAELEALDSLDALCEAAAAHGRRSGKPWLSADSFARLFACALEQQGAPFYAMREQDLESEAYREIYNMLAGAAFDGGLIAMEETALTAVAEGELVCGVCSSRELLRAEAEGLAVLPLPPMKDCEMLTDARLCGLAVCPGGDAEWAARFLEWLYADSRAAQAALDAALAPAAQPDGEAGDALSQCAQLCRLYLPDENGGYRLHGAEFEQSFRAALALLG